jgi:hypothetical protein
MKILYVGDVMGEVGIEIAKAVLPKLKADRQIDLVIAQAENVSQGKGIIIKDYRQLQKAGVDFFTGGNWSLHRKEIWPLLEDKDEPVIRPANYLPGTPGLGFKYVKDVLVISLLGKIVGKDADTPIDNPLVVVDRILEGQKNVKKAGVVVNFHGDFSSEKVVIGHYLDGRATLVAGDHWHVPTADARVLPAGTAHVTDVGMCGSLDSSLGVKFDSVIPRWRDNKPTRNVLETDGARQFNAVLVTSNQNGLADSIEQIRSLIWYN